jgi:tetratricopeptide (TPR) repeat protein
LALLTGAAAATSTAPARADPPNAHSVRTLLRVEQALSQARARAARLDERRALGLLAEAEEDLLSVLDLRISHAYLGELALLRGMVAAQADAVDLAASAFERAASLDPARKLTRAEASPSTLALANAARARVLARPILPVEVSVEPATASVTFDGEPLGAAGVRGGPHVLAVQAPGFAGYAAILEISDGPRARVRVALQPRQPAPAIAANDPPALPRPRGEGAQSATVEGQRRWPWWVAGAAVIIAGAGAAWAAAASHTGGQPSRTLVVDPGPLPE